MGSGLLGTRGSGFCIIPCLPVLDLSNLSDVSLFQEHLDRAIFRGEKRAWLFGKESSAVWHYQSRGHRAARKVRTALPCPARGEAALLLTSPSAATCFSTSPHRPTRAAFLPSLSCIQGSYGGTWLAAFASPSSVLPDSPAEWPPLRHFLALASQTAKGSGSLRAAMPSQLGPRGPAVRQAGHEAFGENESSMQPWPLIFTAEWTKDRHRYWPALCRSASHRHMASLIQCSSTSLGARKDPGTHFSDIA